MRKKQKVTTFIVTGNKGTQSIAVVDEASARAEYMRANCGPPRASTRLGSPRAGVVVFPNSGWGLSVRIEGGE